MKPNSAGTLTCGHCGSKFLGTRSQIRHKKYEGTTGYCSPFCRSSALRKKAKQKAAALNKAVFKGVCPECGEGFESVKEKKFCSMQCYTSSAQFRAMRRAAAKKGTESVKAIWDKKMQKTCLACGTRYRATKSKQKFCGKLCYRKYLSERFDKWVANPQEIALPQCYDEYMLQEELPCLVDGCSWRGRHLALHVNVAHGIPAEDFKRAAGFNLSTGLVCPDLFSELSGRALEGVAIDEALQALAKDAMAAFIAAGSPRTNYRALEGTEHKKKAMALASPGPIVTCKGCGKRFRQRKIFGKAIYCTPKCRDAAYRAERKLKKVKVKKEA